MIRYALTTARLFAISICCLTWAARSAIGQIEGFTEPFRSVELASDETGTIAEVLVVEGQTVHAGQSIAQLGNDEQSIRLQLARHLATSNSAVEAAKQTLEKRQLIFDRLQSLNAKGHASDSELILRRP